MLILLIFFAKDRKLSSAKKHICLATSFSTTISLFSTTQYLKLRLITETRCVSNGMDMTTDLYNNNNNNDPVSAEKEF